jgi:class 3 adenylate cyclase
VAADFSAGLAVERADAESDAASTPRRRFRVLAALAIASLVVLAHFLPSDEDSLVNRADLALLDTHFRVLRKTAPRPALLDPVLIGIDDATEEANAEYPLALWHRPFGDLFAALAEARPRAVGLDVVLPERSYEGVTPGLDVALFRGLRTLAGVAPLVLAQRVDSSGKKLRPIHTPFVLAAGREALGLDQVLIDPDITVRRFSEREVVARGSVPTFAGQLARALALPVGEGFIDYAVGGPIDYVPMHQVIAWRNQGDGAALRRAFAGKVVLVGTVSHGEDRLKLPVALTAFDRGPGASRTRQPGVIVHLQTLRSLGSDGLVRPLPLWVTGLLAPLALFPLLWRRRLPLLAMRSGMFVLATLALALWLLNAGWYLPVAAVLLTLALALAAHGIEAMRERVQLKASFGGQVSPAVLAAMTGGRLQPGLSGEKQSVCVLFSDIRNFTTASEAMPPERMTALLKRYFDAMVTEVHLHDGTLDKFIGDGMMVIFGAPNRLENPCQAALECANGMLDALMRLNLEIVEDGYEPLAIGIGLNYGPAVVGMIGSSVRHNYSAIGDAVNVAARVEGLTKDLGYNILLTDSVRENITSETELADLGEQPIKGHTPVRVWGVEL